MKSLRAQRASPGYHLVEEFTNLLDAVLREVNPSDRRQRLKVRWLAAHREVKGNEKADEEAKKAAAGDSSPIELLPPVLRSSLPPSLGAIKHQFIIKLREEWAGGWNLSPRKARLERLDEDFPFDKHRKVSDQLTRVQSSLLFQIRSNHLPLNCYLHRIGKAPHKRCEQCWRRRRVEVTETVIHFIFECPSYDYERHALDSKLGRSSRDLKTILSNPDNIRVLLKYIGSTKRLKDLGDVSIMRTA